MVGVNAGGNTACGCLRRSGQRQTLFLRLGQRPSRRFFPGLRAKDESGTNVASPKSNDYPSCGPNAERSFNVANGQRLVRNLHRKLR
jgi:hypothetical protein